MKKSQTRLFYLDNSLYIFHVLIVGAVKAVPRTIAKTIAVFFLRFISESFLKVSPTPVAKDAEETIVQNKAKVKALFLTTLQTDFLFIIFPLIIDKQSKL